MKSWFTIKAQGSDEAEVLIYGEIGYFGILATDLIKEIKALGSPKNLTVRVNSQGGAWVQGLAIYNYLARYPGNVTFIIDGIAASIASMIVMAGKVIMPENTFLMIHDIIGFADGTPDEIRQQAEIFDKLKLSIVQAYAAKSKQTEEKILEMMSTDTWLSAQEAKDLGFCDEISSPVKLAARADLADVFKNVPKALTEKTDPPAAPPVQDKDKAVETDPEKVHADAQKAANERAREIYDLCSKAGVPEAAADYLNKSMTADQVREYLKDAPAIRDACAAAAKQTGIDELKNRASKYIRNGLSLTEVRADLFNAIQAVDPHDINNKLPPGSERGSEPKGINPSEINARYGKGRFSNGSGEGKSQRQ